jgi:hypothetical protein
MGDGATLDLHDSTISANNGTNHSVTATTGQIGGAGSFSAGSSEYVDLGNPSNMQFTTGDFYIEAWIKFTGSFASGTFPRIVSNLNAASTNGYELLLHDNTGTRANNIYSQLFTGGSSSQFFAGSTGGGIPITTNTIFYVSSRRASGDTFPDCAMLNNQGHGVCVTGAAGLSSTNVNIGRYPGGASQYWTGFLDEVRFSNVVRGDPWILAQYNNQFSPSTFYTVGSETPIVSPSISHHKSILI